MTHRPERGFAYWKALAEEGAETVVDAFLARLEHCEPSAREAALAYLPARADLIEAFEAAATTRGPLRGIPYALKDLFALANAPLRAGSALLEEVYQRPRADGPLVAHLRASGAVCVAKTHLNAFAYGLTGRNADFGDCPHPDVPGALAGGSSSGSAWAVGRGVVPLGIGTDTAGSIRVPAAMCGLYGMRVPKREWTGEGCFPLAPEFDTAGWLTHSAEDMLEANEALLGPPRSHPGKGLRLLNMVPQCAAMDPELEPAIMELCNWLNAVENAEVTAWLAFNFVGCAEAYTILSSAEAANVHSEWLDPFKDRYDPVVWQRIDRGRHWPGEKMASARRVQKTVIRAFRDAFLSFDAIVMPVMPVPTPEASALNDDFRAQLLDLNTPASVARLPALTVPVMLESGRSSAVQVLFPGMLRLRAAEVLALLTGQRR